MKITNCPNCGAPLSGMKCEYCGTELKANYVNVGLDDNESPYGILDIGGHEYKVYFAGVRMDVENVTPNIFTRYVDKLLLKRTFTLTLIEA